MPKRNNPSTPAGLVASLSIGLALAGVALASPAEPTDRSREIEARLLEQIPGSGIDPSFDADGLRLRGAADEGITWELGLRLLAHGRAGAMKPAAAGVLRTSDHRSELDRGSLREWVVRAGKTFTQGFSLAQPPYVDPDGPGGAPAEAGWGDLLFDLELSGSFEASLTPSARSLELRDGQTLFTYRNLSAVDATGRQLPIRLELEGSRLRLRVDDSGAIYPLAVLADVTQLQKLIQPTALAGENAGWSVAIDGDTAVVGARFADTPFTADAGKAYLFQRDQGGPDNWGLVKELIASDPQQGANFGVSVAISGDFIAVGANNFDDFLVPDSGRAYLFARNQGGLDNWGQIKMFTNATPLTTDLFGWSVALDGDTLVISALLKDQPFLIDAGEVYVHQKDEGGFDNWGLVATLQAPTPAPFDGFGHDVAIDGDTLVVGTYLDDVDSIIDAGAAYIFERDQGGPDAWGLVTAIKANDGETSDRFGDSVAIDGDTIVVGADFDNVSGTDSGSAYVFERNLGGANFWGQAVKLVATDQTESDYFGWAVAIEGDTILIGAHYDDSPLVNAGSAYLFGRDQGGPGAWGEIGKFTADVMTAGDDFGIAVDLSGGTLLVGADLDDDVFPGAGAAYVFDLADSANLVMTMTSAPDPVPAGGVLTYTVTVENLGPDSATDVEVMHTLPAGVSGPTSVGCAEDGAWVGTCSLGTLAAGAMVQYTVSVTVDGGTSGILTHTATVSSATGDPSLANNTVVETTLVGGGGGGSADLLLLKQDSTDPAAPGAPLTYTLEVLNNGPDEALGVVVTETLPAAVSGGTTSGCAEDPAGLPTCTLGSVLPGTSKSYTVTVTVDPGASGSLINTATVSASTGDPVTENNTASEATALGLGTADLLIIMDDTPDPVTAGDLLTYTIEVLNNGPDPAPGTVVVPNLPASVGMATSVGCAEDPAGATGCSLGEIAPGSSKQFTLTVETDPAVFDILIATATVSSDATDPIPLNDMTTEATTVEAAGEADLFVFQTDSVDPVGAGDTLVYTIIVGNSGPATAANVLLTTLVDDQVSNAIATGCAGGTSGVPSCDLGSIEPNRTKVVMVTVEVKADATGTLVNHVSVSSVNTDPDPTDNSADETTTVLAAPGMADLIVLVEDSVDPATPGGPLSYSVTVINLGPHQADAVSVASTVPALLGNVSTTGCAEDPAGAVGCSLGTLPANGVVQFTLTGTLPLTATGPLSFSAGVSSATDDPTAANNTVTEITQIDAIALADLAISLVEAEDPVAPGSSAVYTVTVENLGPDDATAVVVASSVLGNIGMAVTTGCSEDPAGLAGCTLGTIASGASAMFTLELPIPADTTGTELITEVSVSSAVADPDTANNSASEMTLIDGEPPTVENLDSLGATGDGVLAECEEARVAIDSLLVTFSDAMNDPAGDGDPSDVTNPVNYQLVATGPDRKLSTQQCGAAMDDDFLVPIAGVTYDAATLTATLDFGGILDDGPYRLLVCGTTLADTAGTVLDGDGDGTSGGDFERYFRIETENLFSIGHFDCNLDGWSEEATSDNEITYSAFDVDSALESGAAVVYQFGSTPVFSIGQCVTLPGKGTLTMSGSLWLRDLGTGDSLDVSQVCEFFPQAGCLGGVVGMESTTETLSATTAGWGAMQTWSFDLPPAATSALCSVDLDLVNDGDELTVLIDDLFLTDRAFKDGFESGDTSSWSATVGN